MSLFVLTFWKTIAANERYYIVSTVTHEKVVSRPLEWTENYPRKLTIQLENRAETAADNLISSSFAGWSAGTGALDIGDRVNYTVRMTSDPTVETQVFWGIITEVSQTSGGILTIVAKDYLEKFEHVQPNAIIFKNYRDGTIKSTTEGVGARTVDGCTETGIVWPPVFVGIATTDTRTTLSGAGSNLEYLMVSTIVPAAPDTLEYWYSAQAFVALGDGMIGLRYYYQSTDISIDGHIHCAIQADLNGAPSGTDIASSEYLVGLGTNVNTPVQIDFTDELSSQPVPLEKGKKYWVVFSCDDSIRCTEDVGGFVAVIWHTGVAALPFTDHYWWRLHTGAWTESAADENLTIRLDFCDYEEVAAEDYYFDDAANTITVRTNGVPITPIDTYYDLHRGKVSYYYGAVDTGDIFSRLIGYDPDATSVIAAAYETAYSLYQTRGKSVAECLRELCDTFETAGAFDGYQHIISAYRTGGGVDTINAGWRPYATGRTFSHGADSVVDDEIRITSVNLKRTTSLRPASVMVIGKAPSGLPIIVQRDDRALTASFRTKSKLALMTTHTDESINTLVDADRKAWQILDSFARDTWEGTITVAGVFPDLFQLNQASPYYGAGGHIDLNYSPLGIVAAEFHVKGIVLHENTTEIQISNEDVLILNALTEARGRAERSESFLAPDDPFTTVFASGYTSDIEAGATMYMQLCTADETNIPEGVRVLCTHTTNTRYNDSTYHAEFETNEGHTVDGTNHVVQLELWDATTGGTHHAKVALSASEHFPKWRTTRVIAEIHCKAAA